MTVLNDRVRVTTRVDVPPDVAFAVFTEEIDLWWKRGPRFRFGRGKSGGGALGFENAKRLVERFDDGSEVEVGKVLVWQVGVRLVFEWRLTNFAADECTEVELTFTPSADGEATSVQLEHRGWSKIRADHPARHGWTDEAFTVERAMWWNEIAGAYRRRTAARAR